MSKIYITNDSHLGDDEAILLVYQVMKGGRVSGNGQSYCHATTFGVPGRPATSVVHAKKVETGDSFLVEAL